MCFATRKHDREKSDTGLTFGGERGIILGGNHAERITPPGRLIMTKKRKKLLLVLLTVPTICVTILAGIVVFDRLSRPVQVFDYDDPENLWRLAERTERYLIQANRDEDPSARREALRALEDIALLDVSDGEKILLIRERFPEESFWDDTTKSLLRAAESGDPEAQFQLGRRYSNQRRFELFLTGGEPVHGGCVMKSELLAAKWFRKAAVQGHAGAQSSLYISYLRGGHPAEALYADLKPESIYELIGREMDAWDARAAMQGDPEALVRGAGPDSDLRKNRQAGLAILREKAEQGEVADMLELAYSLPSEYEEEKLAWFLRAAELGSVEGMVSYAHHHERVMEPEDGAEDVDPVDWTWRQKAFDAAMRELDKGSAQSLRSVFSDSINLTNLERFTGGESEEEFIGRLMPRLWDQIARHGDYEDAPRTIRYIANTLKRSGIPGLDQYTLARHFAELGMFQYQMHHIWTLLSGVGGEEEPDADDAAAAGDRAEAVRLLRKLAGFGYAEAQYTLGTRYWRGDLSAYGVPQDKTRAVEWFRKAAEQRHLAAMAALSECLWQGEGTPRDRIEALEWSSRAHAYPEYDSYIEYLLHRAWESLQDFAGSLRSFLTDLFE